MKKTLLLILAALGKVVAFAAEIGFLAAEPVWPVGEERTVNSFFAFRTRFSAKANESWTLRVTAGYDYRAELNGEFVAFGPARTAPGFFRVDEWALKPTLGDNRLEIRTAGYNCNNFYLPVQTPFLQAELLKDGAVVAATGEAGQFAAYRTGRVQKTPRHSYQRVFAEVYHLPEAPNAPLKLAAQPLKTLKSREWPRPDFSCTRLTPLSREAVQVDKTAKVNYPRFVVNANPTYVLFPLSELEDDPFTRIMQTKVLSRRSAEISVEDRYPLANDEGMIFAADRIHGGFAGIAVEAKAPTTVYLSFEEVLNAEGGIEVSRSDTLSTVTWHLDRPGKYRLESFEPYGFKYARVLVEGGKAIVSAPWIRNYESSAADRAKFSSSDPALEKIFEAARASYRANAVDCLNDCPSRERGGWLGDTFFTGRASQWLTGSGENERLFLENFLLPRDFGAKARYRGLVPAIWPADMMCRECFIPTYDLWLIMELESLVSRNGYREFAEAFRPRVMEILAYLERYLNDDGLLQHLPGWVFVEWSRANLLVYDVNYPSNMMYAEALDAVSRLYDLPQLAVQAATIREKIRRRSFNGEWFCDNSVVVGECGELGSSGESTEVCQYYAFFTGTATPKSHPELYRRLMDEFGPNRLKAGRYPKVHKSNFLFGTCLRMELLSRAGRSRQMLSEIRDYFLYMADRTGSLWENQTPNASCCHGFASIASEYLFRDVLGVRKIDRLAKTVTFRPPTDLDLEWCEGTVPLSATEVATLAWKRSGKAIAPTVSLPQGWQLVTE